MSIDPRLVAALHEADGNVPILGEACNHDRTLGAFLADDRTRDWLAERLHELNAENHHRCIHWEGVRDCQIQADFILGREP